MIQPEDTTVDVVPITRRWQKRARVISAMPPDQWIKRLEGIHATPATGLTTDEDGGTYTKNIK